MFSQSLIRQLAGLAAVASLAASGHAQAISVIQNSVIGPGMTSTGTVFNNSISSVFEFHTNHTNSSGVVWDGMTVSLQEWNVSDYATSLVGNEPLMEPSPSYAPHVKVNGVMQMMGWSLSWSPTHDQATFNFTGFAVNPGDVLHVGGLGVDSTVPTNWRLHFAASAAPVPLPGALPLLMGGLVLLGSAARMRRRAV